MHQALRRGDRIPRRLALACVAAACLHGLGCRRRVSPAGPTGLRLVSLTPNTTETIFALGAGDALVGRSRYCDYPEQAQSIPVVGGYADPSLEAILALRPDIVVGSRGPAGRRLVDVLRSRGIDVYFPSTESVDEIVGMIAELARLVTRPNEGRALVSAVRTSLDSLRASLQNRVRPRTLMLLGLAPIVVAGPGSYAEEILRLAGGENVVIGTTRYPTVSLESVIGWDADLLVDATAIHVREQPRVHGQLPGWKAVRAVVEGHVVAVRDDVVLRPGPRVAAGVRLLARGMHPEADLG